MKSSMSGPLSHPYRSTLCGGDYPKMRGLNLGGMIVMFISPTEGTVVHKRHDDYLRDVSPDHRLGGHYTDWNPEAFSDFLGTITITVQPEPVSEINTDD